MDGRADFVMERRFLVHRDIMSSSCESYESTTHRLVRPNRHKHGNLPMAADSPPIPAPITMILSGISYSRRCESEFNLSVGYVVATLYELGAPQQLHLTSCVRRHKIAQVCIYLPVRVREVVAPLSRDNTPLAVLNGKYPDFARPRKVAASRWHRRVNFRPTLIDTCTELQRDQARVAFNDLVQRCTYESARLSRSSTVHSEISYNLDYTGLVRPKSNALSLCKASTRR